jgi:hypothetical protein
MELRTSAFTANEAPMTQELILVVLLSGLVALVWIMTLAIVDGDRPQSERPQPSGSSDHANDAQQQDGGLKHHTVAI